MGLVDFPTLYQGREVLLCWRPGEERGRKARDTALEVET